MNFVKNISLILLLLMCSSVYANAGCKDCIIGKVRNDDGKTLAGVEVTARQGGKNIKSTQTNKKGKFELTNLKPGKYNLVFDKAGYGTGVLRNVEVISGKRNNLRDRLILKVDLGSLIIVEASVFNQNGFSLYGAKVIIEEILEDGTAKKVGSGYASQDGDVTFRFAEKTTKYRITASVKGISESQEIEVNEAAIYRASITLDLSKKRK